jgi:ankyrin repeat protein
MGACASSDVRGMTDLMEALRVGDIDAVKTLLTNDLALRAALNSADVHGATPLEMACGNGHVHLAHLLLRNGVSPLRVSPHTGATPLLLAARRGHADTCALLMENGADPQERDAGGRTGLHHAALLVAPAVAYAFLAEGCSVLATDAKGDTPLAVAARKGTPAFQVCKMLLEAPGARADVRNSKVSFVFFFLFFFFFSFFS